MTETRRNSGSLRRPHVVGMALLSIVNIAICNSDTECSVTSPCSDGECRSEYGFYGSTPEYCEVGCGSQCNWPSQPALGKGLIASYWGQDGIEGTLASNCQTGNYDVVIAGSPSDFWQRRNPAAEPSGSYRCNQWFSSRRLQWTQQRYKHLPKQRKHIALIISGRDSKSYGIVSPQDAHNNTTFVWNNFLGGNSTTRPSGSEVLDGVDLDIEAGGAQYYSNLAVKLYSFYGTGSRKYHLVAAPQCAFPDPYLGPGANSRLQTQLFDYIWVQFYNNPPCEIIPGDDNPIISSFQTWSQALPHSKIFLGLPASPEAAGDGFIPADYLMASILPKVKTSPNYGGVML